MNRRQNEKKIHNSLLQQDSQENDDSCLFGQLPRIWLWPSDNSTVYLKEAKRLVWIFQDGDGARNGEMSNGKVGFGQFSPP